MLADAWPRIISSLTMSHERYPQNVIWIFKMCKTFLENRSQSGTKSKNS